MSKILALLAISVIVLGLIFFTLKTIAPSIVDSGNKTVNTISTGFN